MNIEAENRMLNNLANELDRNMNDRPQDVVPSSALLIGVQHDPTDGKSLVVMHLQGQRFEFTAEAARSAARLLTQVSYIIDPPKPGEVTQRVVD